MFKEIFTEASEARITYKKKCKSCDTMVFVDGNEIGKFYTLPDDDRYEYHFEPNKKHNKMSDDIWYMKASKLDDAIIAEYDKYYN